MTIPTSFLSLPRELRDLVYSHYLRSARVEIYALSRPLTARLSIRIINTIDDSPHFASTYPWLLLSRKQIRQECLEYIADNKLLEVHFYNDTLFDLWPRFKHTLPTSVLQRTKRIQIIDGGEGALLFSDGGEERRLSLLQDFSGLNTNVMESTRDQILPKTFDQLYSLADARKLPCPADCGLRHGLWDGIIREVAKPRLQMYSSLFRFAMGKNLKLKVCMDILVQHDLLCCGRNDVSFEMNNWVVADWDQAGREPTLRLEKRWKLQTLARSIMIVKRIKRKEDCGREEA